ncbi:unnamed protein product, partial [Anisakis simplex]|uniref:Uncharacterized protein n=1 Tax=Anisakis simplex TaxID=6269 RepID=A0A0M3KEC5_ANISI
MGSNRDYANEMLDTIDPIKTLANSIIAILLALTTAILIDFGCCCSGKKKDEADTPAQDGSPAGPEAKNPVNAPGGTPAAAPAAADANAPKPPTQ